jgi:hypothetical protein
MARTTKDNGGETKSCLGQVFNFKLGRFDVIHILNCVGGHPHLELKIRPSFCPASCSLSIEMDLYSALSTLIKEFGAKKCND